MEYGKEKNCNNEFMATNEIYYNNKVCLCKITTLYDFDSENFQVTIITKSVYAREFNIFGKYLVYK